MNFVSHSLGGGAGGAHIFDKGRLSNMCDVNYKAPETCKNYTAAAIIFSLLWQVDKKCNAK